MSEEKYQPIRRSDDHDDDDQNGNLRKETEVTHDSLFDDDVVVYDDDGQELTDTRRNKGDEGVSFAWRKQNGSVKGDFQRISATDDSESASDCADDQTQHASNVKHEKELSVTSSLDFDDDDDDDFGLSRYNLDFTRGATDRLRNPTSALEESLESGSIDFKVLWQVFLEAREESRRRRLEKLLNAESDLERFNLCVSSWCDLTDRGLILFLSSTAMLVIVCYVTENVLIIFIGFLVILIRIMWTPAYWFLRGRHLERKRKITIELYDKMNSPDSTIGHHVDGQVPNGVENKNGSHAHDNDFV